MTAFKCSICGGDLKNDYSACISFCRHCGNKWPLAETDKDFDKHEHIIRLAGKAGTILAEGENSLKQVEEAMLLYKNASAQCSTAIQVPIISDLHAYCNSGIKQCSILKKYLTAKEHFTNGAYSKALKEFTELGDFKDCPQMAEQCKEGIVTERKKRIPYSIVVGLILPAILFFFLKEKLNGIPVAAVISAVAAVPVIYGIYLGGTLSILLEVLSFILLVPLLLFMFFVYVLHLSAVLAAWLAIGIPILIMIIIGLYGSIRQ